MHTMESHWEDEENNRRVAYSVEYARHGEAIEIKGLTPKQVTFVCPTSKSPLRTIGVWTEKGRELLSHQLRTSGHVAELKEQIESGLAV